METFASVAVENTAVSFDALYDYIIPSALLSAVAEGVRVFVPFGNGGKKRQGFVFKVKTSEKEPGVRYKSILSVIDDEPVLNGEGLQMAEFLKDRTFCALYEAAKTMLPAGLAYNTAMSYAARPDIIPGSLLSLDSEEKRVVEYLSGKGGYSGEDKISRALGLASAAEICEKLMKDGFLAANYDHTRKIGDLSLKVAKLALSDGEIAENYPGLSKKQTEVINVLRDAGAASVKELCYFTGFTESVVTALEKKGIIETDSYEILRKPRKTRSGIDAEEEITLSEEQEKAYAGLLQRLETGQSSASLLYGVTGSGKTKVYLKLIEKTLELGKTVMVMVPEIVLTPQILELFYSRFGETVAVFHSGLSIGERLDEWKRVKRGEAKIAVGTRSAVFSPLENIGLIIIDEEQEHTYKSERSPRYHAKDVAKFRAAHHGALLLLSSATPSIETYSAALSGRYGLFELSERYGGAVLPEVMTVDMTNQLRYSPYASISGRLAEKIADNLKKGNQTILLLNHRGYNTFVACSCCKRVMGCPNCSISLTYHSANGRLMCHYCGYSEGLTDICPECGEKTVRYSGAGTQKIEKELSESFPDAKILRMDADTTSTKNSHEKKLGAFAGGEYDILLGTQMVAKGLDFPSVTLVGVVSADSRLFSDDYKSLERTFSLLTQVIGRAGRGSEPGLAVIQTFNPENEVIRLAADQDYKSFYELEMIIRKAMVYPPFCDICVIGVSGADETAVRAGAKKFLNLLENKNKQNYPEQSLMALGPIPARVGKVNNNYRYRIIIKCKNSKRFREMISGLLTAFSKDAAFKKITVFADINPESVQ
ncbi:MAG: primosomal protein N' [Oscillospiraceae bacterium]|nr:primosomal protein N' [Oscillospiraceae bacterium]